jgi:hypothetical protein
MNEPSTTSWGDTRTNTPAALTAIVLEGKLVHVWDLPYGDGTQKAEIVYDMFAAGVRVDIEVKISGLDLQSRRALGDLFAVAHALRSVGSWTFEPEPNEAKTKLDKKIEFLRSLSEPMWALFLEQHQTGYIKQIQEFEKRRELLGKTTPDRR